MTNATCRNRTGSLVATFAALACCSGAAVAATSDCPGDTDASGSVGIGDFLTVLGEWGCSDPPGPCAGDVSGDGHVNIEDLQVVLLNWGPCSDAAMSAASAGRDFARQMLSRESARFVVTESDIDAGFAAALWHGTYPNDGSVIVGPPDGYSEPTLPNGVGEALLHGLLAETNAITPVPGDELLPMIDKSGTLHARPIALLTNPDGTPDRDGPYFRLTYELLDGFPHVRVTSAGVVGALTHTQVADLRINKKIAYAIISPARVMIGKNVSVTGAVGTRYGIVSEELDADEADPLVMRSDFYFLDAALDATLDVLVAMVVIYDTDGDGRLRLDHPTEGLAALDEPGVIIDTDGNEYVDDFDLFMARYDVNGDGWVVYDQLLANDAGMGTPAEEFAGIDDQLARLIDEVNPDRDGDGLATPNDRLLGYRDGILDIRDTYTKVRGRLLFATQQGAWELAHGASYQTVVQGPIIPGTDESAVVFEAGDRVLPEITADMFQAAVAWFEGQVPNDPPSAPVDFELQRDAGVAAGGEYVEGGLGLNWESIPFGAGGAYDYYDRPVYRNMTFTDVRIPMGNNGLYENCEFHGVTFIETEPDCIHVNWNYTGALEKMEDPPGSGNYIYEIKYPGVEAELDGIWIADTKPYSNNLRFHDCTFIGSVAGDTPHEMAHWRNHVQFTGETRFYVDPDDPDLDEQVDAASIRAVINALDPSHLDELRRSSIFLPGWASRIGIAGGPEDRPKVKLVGTIVAGMLDARGTIDFHGTLMITFRAVADAGPLFYGGHPSAFRNAIGWFDPYDGAVGRITVRHDPGGTLPDGIPWHLSVEPAP